MICARSSRARIGSMKSSSKNQLSKMSSWGSRDSAVSKTSNSGTKWSNSSDNSRCGTRSLWKTRSPSNQLISRRTSPDSKNTLNPRSCRTWNKKSMTSTNAPHVSSSPGILHSSSISWSRTGISPTGRNSSRVPYFQGLLQLHALFRSSARNLKNSWNVFQWNRVYLGHQLVSLCPRQLEKINFAPPTERARTSNPSRC